MTLRTSSYTDENGNEFININIDSPSDLEPYALSRSEVDLTPLIDAVSRAQTEEEASSIFLKMLEDEV